MLRTVKRIAPILILIAAVLLAYNFSAAANISVNERAAAPVPKGNLVTTIEASPEDQAAALAMWTKEASLAAEPMAWTEEVADDPLASRPEPTGGPGIAIGGIPDPDADASAMADFPEEWGITPEDVDEAILELELADQMDDPEGTPAVFTYYRSNYYSTQWKKFPYRAIGKLFFNTPGGGSSCSASVISPNNIIVTAAHCVYDTNANVWYDDWVFRPAWRNGTSPYGSFPWSSARVLNDWINASGTVRRYDVALILLGNNSAGNSVTYYTGWLGRSWNYSYVQHLFAFGYPSNLSSGLYTYACAAETFDGGTDVLGMGCNMTYGSSGGPWIRKFWPQRTGDVNYVNSVVSGGTPGTNTFYGPRFSSSNIVPLCNPTSGWSC